MATGDKSDLLASLANNITDNQNKENTPARHRTYASKIITYCLNLVEATKQIVQGAIDFTSQVEFTTRPTHLGADLVTVNDLEIAPIAYCDYTNQPNLTLTTTEQLVTGWTEEVASVGISESNGVFTALLDGVYNVTLERIYENDDSNPSLVVNVTIRVYADDQQGGGPIIVFDRTAPLSSATAGDEPAILGFTTPANRPIIAGTEFTVYVSGEDNGGNPTDTRLIRAKVVANLIHKLPGA